MARGRADSPLAAVLVGLCVSANVEGFAVTVRRGMRLPPSTTTVGRSGALGQLQAVAATSSAEGSSPKAFGGLLGDKVASVIVNSPVYPFLAEQAKDTMKKSAQVRLRLIDHVIVCDGFSPCDVRYCLYYRSYHTCNMQYVASNNYNNNYS